MERLRHETQQSQLLAPPLKVLFIFNNPFGNHYVHCHIGGVYQQEGWLVVGGITRFNEGSFIINDREIE